MVQLAERMAENLSGKFDVCGKVLGFDSFRKKLIQCVGKAWTIEYEESLNLKCWKSMW